MNLQNEIHFHFCKKAQSHFEEQISNEKCSLVMCYFNEDIQLERICFQEIFTAVDKQVGARGWHSTKVAWATLTQLPWAWFLAFQKIYFQCCRNSSMLLLTVSGQRLSNVD